MRETKIKMIEKEWKKVNNKGHSKSGFESKKKNQKKEKNKRKKNKKKIKLKTTNL